MLKVAASTTLLEPAVTVLEGSNKPAAKPAVTAADLAKVALVPLISSEQIAESMKITAKQIKGDYEGKIITIVAIMKGAITVTADLMRELGQLNVPCTLECISTSSYGKNGTNRGELVIRGIELIEIEGKDVLLVDDAFDSGATMAAVVERFQQLKPGSLRSMVAVVKEVARKTTYYPEYVLFEIPNYFIVGYGLDCSEHFRQLPDIRYLKDNCTPECLK